MWRKQKHLKIFLLVFFLMLLGGGDAYAADFNYSINTQYELSKDNKVTVKKTLNVKNTVNSPTPTSLRIPFNGQANNLEAKYLTTAGQPKISISSDSSEFIVDNIKSFKGKDKKWGIVVEYQTDLLSDLGKSKLLGFVPLVYDYEVSEKVEFVVPLSMNPAVRGSEPDKVRISLGAQIISWQSNKAINETFQLVFGEHASSVLIFDKKLNNDSFWWQDVEFVLPPENNQQKVFIKSIEPKPRSVGLDIDGNVIAKYRLAPKTSLDVRAEVFIDSNNQNYALDKSSEIEVPELLAQRYLGLVGSWDGTSLDFETDKTDSIGLIRELIKEVNQVEFNQGTSEYNASLSISNSMIGELRANGLPARLILGKYFNGSNFTDRAWLEVYAPKIGWMTIDPLMQRWGDHFGSTDARYLALTMRGTDPDYPPTDLSALQVSYTNNDFPEQSENPYVSGTKYHILPGVALLISKVDMPNGRVVDSASLLVNGEAKKLGSLSPMQNVSVKSFKFLGAAYSTDQMSFESDILSAQTETKNNYLPLATLILLIGAYFSIRKYLNRGLEKLGGPKVEFAQEDSGDNIEHQDLIAQTVMDTTDVQPKSSFEAGVPSQKETNEPSLDRINRRVERPRRKSVGRNLNKRLTLVQ